MGDVNQVSVNHATGEPDSLAILSGVSGEILARMGGIPVGEPGFFLRANRAQLRKYLAQNISISFGKRFESLSTDEGGVTAIFSDGTSARGSLLVGADGGFSKVRQALLGPEQVSQGSSIISINGTLTLPREEFESVRRIANSLVLAADPACLFNIGTTSVAPDGQTADFYWGVAWNSQQLLEDIEWQRDADAETLLQKAKDLTKNMPSHMTDFISKTAPEGVRIPSVRFNEYMPPESIPNDCRVTLVGDSAHTMIPYKGAGANTALQDCGDLGRLITEQLSQTAWDSNSVAKTIGQYHQTMLPRGRQMVAESHVAGQMSGGILAVTHGRVHQRI